MQIGLLWFDNDPHRELAAKIEDAARRYREKFGMVPNTCYVNQATWDGQSTVVRGKVAAPAMRVIPAGNILPHHFWVGVEES